MTACEDYFRRNAWQWEVDADRIKYAVGRFKKPSRAQYFGARYRCERDGTEDFIVRPAHLCWDIFVSALKKRFLLSLDGQEAKNQMVAEKYS
jgi:hypothetical protein